MSGAPAREPRGWRRAASASLALAALLASSTPAAADRLHRRGEEAPLEGRTLDVTNDGVHFRVPRGAETGDVLITWDRVRLLETDRGEFAEAFEQRRDLSVRLWRARSRVERGDHSAAEPILDELFTKTRGHTDSTSLIVAEGLLRCRLAREARAAAVLPWLETHRLLSAGVKSAAYQSMPPVIDLQSGLCVQLPPIWTRSVGVEEMLADLSDHVGETPVSARLATLYARAARLSLGLGVEDSAEFYHSDEQWDRDGGVVVITAFVATLERVRPRPLEVEKVLARPLREAGPLTPWALFLRGLGRVNDSNADRRRDGLVDLLTIPALHRDENRYLAGFAIDRAAAALEQMGRSAAAASLRAEFKRTDPAHPLNNMAPPTRLSASEKQP